METQKEYIRNIKISMLLKKIPTRVYVALGSTFIICILIIKLNKTYGLSFEVWFNFFSSLFSTFLGVIGGFYLSRIQDNKKETEKALSVKRNLLEILKTEIENNKIIFSEDYFSERLKNGTLNLHDKREFETREWEQLKFKVFTEGIIILDQTGFEELNEIYKRLDRINLQKSFNKAINEQSKIEMLTYINDHIYDLNKLLRAED